jgi:hypothetical protein
VSPRRWRRSGPACSTARADPRRGWPPESRARRCRSGIAGDGHEVGDRLEVVQHRGERRRPRDAAVCHRAHRLLVRPVAVLDRVDAEVHDRANERAHHVHGEPAALLVDRLGDLAQQLRGIAHLWLQRVEVARREVGDHLDPRPTGAHAAAIPSYRCGRKKSGGARNGPQPTTPSGRATPGSDPASRTASSPAGTRPRPRGRRPRRPRARERHARASARSSERVCAATARRISGGSGAGG